MLFFHFRLLDSFTKSDIALQGAAPDRVIGAPNFIGFICSQINALKSYVVCSRVTNLWNSLPNEVVTALSLNIFKNRLDKHPFTTSE